MKFEYCAIISIVLIAAALADHHLPPAREHSVGAVGDCMHKQLKECRVKCQAKVPDAKGEAIGKCFHNDTERRRTVMRECLASKGLTRDSDCFKINRTMHLYPAIHVEDALDKLDAAHKEKLKESHKCFKECLDEHDNALEKCQEGCAVPNNETKTNLKQCLGQIKQDFPSESLKQCVRDAFGN